MRERGKKGKAGEGVCGESVLVRFKVKRGKEERKEGREREWVVGKEGSGWWKGRKGGRVGGWEEADMFGFS
jgi:hypothetical protein